MSRNSVTGDALISRNPTDEYREGFDRIFGRKQPVCPACGKVKPAEIHTCSPQVEIEDVQEGQQ